MPVYYDANTIVQIAVAHYVYRATCVQHHSHGVDLTIVANDSPRCRIMHDGRIIQNSEVA